MTKLAKQFLFSFALVNINLAISMSLLFVLSSCNNNDDNSGSSSESSNTNCNLVLLEEFTNSISNSEGLKIAQRLEVPKLKGTSNFFIIHKDGRIGVNYVTEWDMQKKSPRWSAYTMYYFSNNNTNISGNANRYSGDPQYPYDEDMPNKYYWDKDYFWGSGYDHGHVVASADRLCSSNANYQTFYLTNMQPMDDNFNCGVWSKMEALLRNWAKYQTNNTKFADTLYIVKGGTIDDETKILKRISSKLIVPKYYYMAVLCKNDKIGVANNYGYKAMAFYVEHKSGLQSYNLKQYAISISELEQKTGIDFFCNLPDDIEKAVESNFSPNAWNW